MNHTIEPDGRDGFWVVEHGEYGRGSVLEGQYKRALIEHFDTLEEAQEHYPAAEVIDHSTKNPWAEPVLSDVPPSWFDELDAGERWSDDY